MAQPELSALLSKHDNFGSKQEAEERKRSRDKELKDHQDLMVKQVSDYYAHSRQDNIYTKDEDPPHMVNPASSNKDSKDRKPLHRPEPVVATDPNQGSNSGNAVNAVKATVVEPVERIDDVESLKSKGAFSMETQFILDLIQEVSGREAFKKALANLKNKPRLPSTNEPPGTILEELTAQVKQTVDHYLALSAKSAMITPPTELAKLEARIDKMEKSERVSILQSVDIGNDPEKTTAKVIDINELREQRPSKTWNGYVLKKLPMCGAVEESPDSKVYFEWPTITDLKRMVEQMP